MKTYTLFVVFAAALSSLAAAEEGRKHACCPTEPAPTTATATDGYSKDSLYQLNADFVNDRGEAVRLGTLRGEPVLLGMFFASCTSACPMLLSDMARIRSELPEAVRRRVRLVLVSFDTTRDTPAVLKQFRETRSLDEQWTLLTGSPEAVSELAALLGVKYAKEANGQFAHSNLLTSLNREGEVVHQRNGFRAPSADCVQTLVAAAVGKTKG